MEIVVVGNRYSRHHFRNLEGHFEGRFVYEESYNPEDILAHRPSLVITFDEHWCELGNAVGQIKAANIATLQIMDGILEWRRTWDYGWNGHRVDGVINPINQPAQAHKIACLGRRDAHLLNSWGNYGKCEVVGASRFDHLVKKRLAGLAATPRADRSKARILVMTAKTPGFTEKQMATTKQSLLDLKAYFESSQHVEVVWRLTKELDEELGIKNLLTDLTGGELHSIIEKVDAVITTPSTSLLESMLMNRPTALLDYHNCPHYFEAGWNIFCQAHIEPVIEEMLAAPTHRMGHQSFLLDEQLACGSPATDRLINLIEAMLKVTAASKGGPLRFPARILEEPEPSKDALMPLSQLRLLYPSFPIPDDMEQRAMKLELAAARGTIQKLYAEVAQLKTRMRSFPGYSVIRKIRQKLKRKK